MRRRYLHGRHLDERNSCHTVARIAPGVLTRRDMSGEIVRDAQERLARRGITAMLTDDSDDD